MKYRRKKQSKVQTSEAAVDTAADIDSPSLRVAIVPIQISRLTSFLPSDKINGDSVDHLRSYRAALVVTGPHSQTAEETSQENETLEESDKLLSSESGWNTENETLLASSDSETKLQNAIEAEADQGVVIEYESELSSNEDAVSEKPNRTCNAKQSQPIDHPSRTKIDQSEDETPAPVKAKLEMNRTSDAKIETKAAEPVLPTTRPSKCAGEVAVASTQTHADAQTSIATETSPGATTTTITSFSEEGTVAVTVCVHLSDLETQPNPVIIDARSSNQAKNDRLRHEHTSQQGSADSGVKFDDAAAGKQQRADPGGSLITISQDNSAVTPAVSSVSDTVQKSKRATASSRGNTLKRRSQLQQSGYRTRLKPRLRSLSSVLDRKRTMSRKMNDLCQIAIPEETADECVVNHEFTPHLAESAETQPNIHSNCVIWQDFQSNLIGGPAEIRQMATEKDGECGEIGVHLQKIVSREAAEKGNEHSEDSPTQRPLNLHNVAHFSDSHTQTESVDDDDDETLSEILHNPESSAILKDQSTDNLEADDDSSRKISIRLRQEIINGTTTPAEDVSLNKNSGQINFSYQRANFNKVPTLPKIQNSAALHKSSESNFFDVDAEMTHRDDPTFPSCINFNHHRQNAASTPAFSGSAPSDYCLDNLRWADENDQCSIDSVLRENPTAHTDYHDMRIFGPLERASVSGSVNPQKNAASLINWDNQASNSWSKELKEMRQEMRSFREAQLNHAEHLKVLSCNLTMLTRNDQVKSHQLSKLETDISRGIRDRNRHRNTNLSLASLDDDAEHLHDVLSHPIYKSTALPPLNTSLSKEEFLAMRKRAALIPIPTPDLPKIPNVTRLHAGSLRNSKSLAGTSTVGNCAGAFPHEPATRKNADQDALQIEYSSLCSIM